MSIVGIELLQNPVDITHVVMPSYVYREKVTVLTVEEWNKTHPTFAPYGSSGSTVYFDFITDKTDVIADAALVYAVLWTPNVIGITYAEELVEPLSKGLKLIKENYEEFQECVKDINHWENLVDRFIWFLETYREACKYCPKATINILYK